MNRLGMILEDIFADVTFAEGSGKGNPDAYMRHTGTMDTVVEAIAFAEAAECCFAGEIMSNVPGDDQDPSVPGHEDTCHSCMGSV